MYCSVNKVRLLSGLESEDVDDSQIRDLRDEVATPELNKDVQVDVEHEQVDFISNEKENKIDGSNITFYTQKTHKSQWQIGDRNGDATIDGSDVEAYYIDDDTRVDDLSVTLKDRNTGKIEVTESNGDAIPGTSELFLNYSAAPVDMDTPDPQIETACAQLTAAYVFTRIDAGKLQDFSVGNVTVNTRAEGFQKLKRDYRNTVQNLAQREMIQSGKNRNRTKGAFGPDENIF